MAVVISASDETYRGSFCYGGLVAPVKYWDTIFAERWEKRILSGTPRIPFLHMTDIRSNGWRTENNISASEADNRVNQAIDVICKRNDPALFAFQFNGDIFNEHVKRKVLKPNGAAISMGPDYFGFLGYAYLVVKFVREAIPQAEKVDFLVERNGEVTKNLQYFYSGIPLFLESIGRKDLIPLIGDIIPGGKDRSPLQAADVFCWHLRRGVEGTLSGEDLARWGKLHQSKKYCIGHINDDALMTFAESCDRRESDEEATERPVSEIRPDDGATVEGAPQRDQSQAGSGESGKKAEG